MDPRDDPSTTTTTDYDSGESEGVDYVYPGQKAAERKPKTGSPGRKRSPKAKPHGVARCMCSTDRSEEDAEATVFEEDTDTEEDRGHHRRPVKPRPSGPRGSTACDDKEHKGDRKRAAEARSRRAQSPYVEEYPEEVPRPAILLREHRIPRRASTSDARRVRDSEGRSSSSGSRGRSPAGKRLPPRPPRRSSKESPKHHKRRVDHAKFEDKSSEDGRDKAESAGRQHEPEPKRTGVTRSSARNENTHPTYSSSWPLHAGSHLSKGRAVRGDHDYESEDDSEEQVYRPGSGKHDERHRPKQHRRRSSREHDQDRAERRRERQHVREPLRREEPERERARERTPSPPRPSRPRTIVSRASMTTIDQGSRSVATSLCEVWRGQYGDWESPYASPSEDDLDSDLDEPVRLLRMDDLSTHRSSPRLLPPRGDRSDFGFQAATHLPLALPRPAYPDAPQRGPASDFHHTHPRAPPTMGGRLLLDGPPVLTMEPDAMTDDEAALVVRPPSRASHRSGLAGPAPSRAWTYHHHHHHHQPPPQSRAVSPVFSARRTREFLSPRPTRAARFDFGAWGCDRASRSQLALGLL